MGIADDVETSLPPSKRAKLREVDLVKLSKEVGGFESAIFSGVTLDTLASTAVEQQQQQQQAVDDTQSSVEESPMAPVVAAVTPVASDTQPTTNLPPWAAVPKFQAHKETLQELKCLAAAPLSLARTSTAHLRHLLDEMDDLQKALTHYDQLIRKEVQSRPQAVALIFGAYRVGQLKQELALTGNDPDMQLYDGNIKPFSSLKRIILAEALHGARVRGLFIRDLIGVFSDPQSCMDLLSELPRSDCKTVQFEIEDRGDILVLICDRPTDHDKMLLSSSFRCIETCL
jgi:hypothetical protein